ncbi:integral membrane protein [Plectosphaerella cucumerina]|uniref:Integral membrane protein n=1 Tax=Plectosphaerella cucumerina TaxID=40658 RepID=A0A8K0TDY6_9PEZI|nr:integral membrane protein [Plectosphaerella cucumerina]
MRYVWASFLAALCGLLAVTMAQRPGIGDLPPCGLNCLLMTVPASGCSLTDNACQCSNNDLTTATAACLQANCTMQDTLGVARVQAGICQLPHTDDGKKTLVILFSLVGVAFLAYIMRIVSKIVTHSLDFEELIISTAVGLTIVPIVCVKYMVDLGFGKHLWDLEDGALLKGLRLFYIAEVVYIVVLALTKASIIWMYIHIFRTSKTFRNWSHGVLALLALSTLIITPLTIFSCRPLRFFWNKDIRGGTCLDVNALAYAHSGMAIVFDVIIITMPIGMLWRLNMALRRKLLIGVMFAIGGFGLIATVLRLQTLLVFGNSLDPTFDYVPVLLWTTAELAAGIVCTCLPAIRKLLEKPMRRLIDSTRSHRQNHSGETPATPSAAGFLREPKSFHDWSTGASSTRSDPLDTRSDMMDTITSRIEDEEPPAFRDIESGPRDFPPLRGMDDAPRKAPYGPRYNWLREHGYSNRSSSWIPRPQRVSAIGTSWIQ